MSLFCRKDYSIAALCIAETGGLFKAQVDSNASIVCAHTVHGAQSERQPVERGPAGRVRA